MFSSIQKLENIFFRLKHIYDCTPTEKFLQEKTMPHFVKSAFGKELSNLKYL